MKKKSNNFSRFLVAIATLLGPMSVYAGEGKGGSVQADEIPVSASVDEDTGNLRVVIRNDAAKAFFEFLTTSRSTVVTTPGVGTTEHRLGPNIICGHFTPENDPSGASDVYRCSQLVTSAGRSVADGLDPMIGVGN